MSEFLKIRGTVRGVVYEAALKPTSTSDGHEREWHVTAPGVPSFKLVAAKGSVWEGNVRVTIERELERRLAQRGNSGTMGEPRP